jgi:hypothetical protein
MLRPVAVVRADMSEECSTSIITVTGIELGTTLAITGNRRTLQKNTVLAFLRSVRWLLVMTNVSSSLILVTLMMEVLHSNNTSVLT